MAVHHNCQHLPWDAAQRFSPATSCDGWYTLSRDLSWSFTAGFCSCIGFYYDRNLWFKRGLALGIRPRLRVYQSTNLSYQPLTATTKNSPSKHLVIRFAWKNPPWMTEMSCSLNFPLKNLKVTFIHPWRGSRNCRALPPGMLCKVLNKRKTAGRKKDSWHEMKWGDTWNESAWHFSHFQYLSVQVPQHVFFAKEPSTEQHSRAGYLR